MLWIGISNLLFIKRYDEGGIDAVVNYINRGVGTVQEGAKSIIDSVGEQIESMNLTQYLPKLPNLF